MQSQCPLDGTNSPTADSCAATSETSTNPCERNTDKRTRWHELCASCLHPTHFIHPTSPITCGWHTDLCAPSLFYTRRWLTKCQLQSAYLTKKPQTNPSAVPALRAAALSAASEPALRLHDLGDRGQRCWLCAQQGKATHGLQGRAPQSRPSPRRPRTSPTSSCASPKK